MGRGLIRLGLMGLGLIRLGLIGLAAWTLALALLVVSPAAAQEGVEVPAELDAGTPSPVEAPLATSELDAGVSDSGLPIEDAGNAGALFEAGVLEAGVLEAGVLEAGVILDGALTGDGGVEAAAPTGDGLGGGEPIIADAPATAAAVAVASTDVVRTLLGLVVLLGLAWIGGRPAVRRLEERLGISHVVTSGLPFVGLGLLMHAPGVDVLSDETLLSITPLLQFGLGWIGFHTGFQFEARAMDEVPRGTGTLVVLLTSFPLVLIAISCGLVILFTGMGPEGFSLRELPSQSAALSIVRDAMIVGLAGALSAPLVHRVAGGAASARAAQLSRTVGVLDDVFGVIALACLAAWLRPDDAGGWRLPGVGWVFITFGMSMTLGLVVYALLRSTDQTAERSSLLLGSVCFTAGMAGAFELPPLVVCFLAGVLLRNLPGEDKADLLAVFDRLERPIYLVFLLIVGALWRIDDWRGWLLLPVFVLARLGGRYLGARTAQGLPEESRPVELGAVSMTELVTPPMGQLAIAFVVTAQALYESPAIRAIVTAVIGGSVLTELIVQLGARRRVATQAAAPAVAGESALTTQADGDDGPPTQADV